MKEGYESWYNQFTPEQLELQKRGELTLGTSIVKIKISIDNILTYKQKQDYEKYSG